MLTTNLNTLLAPYKLLVSKQALSPTYRCLQLAPGRVTGCSAAAILETKCDHGLKETVCVDAATFLTVIGSLPSEVEVVLSVADGVLLWACGSSKGRIATMLVQDMPTVARKPKPKAWPATKLFAQALLLGGLSADSNALLSIGMYGVVIDNRGPLVVHSSDNVTISACYLGDIELPGPDIMTLTPEPAALLAQVIVETKGTIEFSETEVFYADKYCKLLIKTAPALKHDALKMVDKYDKATLVAGISPDAVTNFIKRAGALAENRKHTYITLEATDGQLAVAFEEGLASADEFYLVQGLTVGDMAPIKLDASKLSRALAHVSDVVLDYVGQKAIILRGHTPEFHYVIGGLVDKAPAN